MDCSLPGSSTHGIFQARVMEWGAIAFSDNRHESIAISSRRVFSFPSNMYPKVECMLTGMCVAGMYVNSIFNFLRKPPYFLP